LENLYDVNQQAPQSNSAKKIKFRERQVAKKVGSQERRAFEGDPIAVVFGCTATLRCSIRGVVWEIFRLV